MTDNNNIEESTEIKRVEQNSEQQSSSQSPSDDEKNWAMLSHLSAFAGLIIPLGNLIAPFLIYLFKEKESAYIREHAVESINFQISFTIALTLAGVLIFVLIGFVLLPIFLIVGFFVMVIASLKASKGESYRYPFTLRLLN